jgi:AraC-like DNA-binding protein
VRAVLAHAGLSRAAGARLLAAAGIPETAADSDACTVPLSRVIAFVDEVARNANDPIFGIRLAEGVPDGTYEAAELLARTAADIGQGLAALADHGALVNPIGRFRYIERSDRAELHYDVAGQRRGLEMHMNEYTVAYVYRRLCGFARTPFTLQSAWFCHKRLADEDEVSTAFGCPVQFGAATCGFAITVATARLPLATSDRVVNEYLRRKATSTADVDATPFSVALIRVILAEVGCAGADLAAVARRLGITPRTAQRRLREEGTTFRDVLDQARMQRAQELVAARTKDDKIATALGFSNTTAFRRAARRWQRLQGPASR